MLRRLLVLSVGVGFVFLTVRAFTAIRSGHVEGWTDHVPTSPYFETVDAAFPARFTDTKKETSARYRMLFDYFLAGFLEFRTVTGERVYYPGMKGNRGHRIEGLEGFARTTPLLAAWIASGREARLRDPRATGRLVNLPQMIRDGLLAGTDPSSATYWGDITDKDQRIVEAADIALTLWLTRDLIWAKLTDPERRRIANWLGQVSDRAVHPNNWLLFKVLVIEILNALGVEADLGISARTYHEFKQHYREAGWFHDPPNGIDYYNAWGITYALFWIDQINPSLDHVFIRDALRLSANLTLHLIAPNGIPIMGRSICYRMAVPAPVLIQAFLDPTDVDPGLARRALDAVWLHFVRNHGLAQGTVTQGYHGPDERFLDRYSGPGSCQWSLRSLVMAFHEGNGSLFWTRPPQPLPVEVRDYKLEFPILGWIVEGDQESGEISIRIPLNEEHHYQTEEHSSWRQVLQFLRHRPYRPKNSAVKYEQFRYSSQKPLTMNGKVDATSRPSTFSHSQNGDF